MGNIAQGAKIGDICWTGGTQYFYVHNIVNGNKVMSGIDSYGEIYTKSEHFLASHILKDTERNKFFELIEKYNLKFNKNRGVYR